ncbi:hypothetical protein GCM10010371_28360 [Streptomyces subrutilus]|uniref:Uncharacterized protein n=1 Tax=Streptomyces subrutilus TaxID=36818 RepID=A0A918V419_9ACTN|nr:hypothetical protein GCM10010371_28360 [Streptomyces subrutilus]
MVRTQEPQSVPALVAEAIWRGVQAPAAAWSFTCLSVIPKQEQTYTRFTSLGGMVRRAIPDSVRLT